MANLSEKEKGFWNEPEMVGYFAQKPADPRIVERLSTVKPTLALDLGSGGGRHSEMLVRMGFDLRACDVNPEMVQATRRRVANTGLVTPELIDQHIVFGEILNIPFAENSFGVVVTTGVLHQARSMNEYAAAIKELDRVTQDNAVVCLNVFTDAVWDEGYSRVGGEDYTVITREGLWQTLLPKLVFYQMMAEGGFGLEAELAEDIKQENTGPRAVLRANFVKGL